MDATHVKARANNKKMQKRIAHEEALFFEEILKKEINEDREAHVKPLLKEKDDDNHPSPGAGGKEGKTMKESTSDPESGWFRLPVIRTAGFWTIVYIPETTTTAELSKHCMTR